MLQAFVIVLRESFEAFLIVAITAAYLRKTSKDTLIPAVWWGVGVSVATSALFGWLMLQTASEPMWEAAMGFISAIFVLAFVIHMWKTAPTLKKDMECRLSRQTQAPGRAAFVGVFFFVVFMITREGMETALLLIQVHSSQVVSGSILGVLAALLMAFLWNRVGHLLNLKLFFQVTAIFLMLFVAQVLIYSFHELTETGLLPGSEALHLATESYGPDGLYGRWISPATVGFCAAWMLWALLKDKFFTPVHFFRKR
jgi:high-affinity iron transporter